MKVHSPLTSGNSKVNLRVNPGPNELIPSFADTFLLSLVWMKTSRLPIGIAASLEISIVTWIMSSSSSSISSDADIRRHSSGLARVTCSSLILTLPPFLNNR